LDAAVAKLATNERLDAAVAKLATKEDLEAAVARMATKDELAAAIAPLATKDELAAAIAPLATKEELAQAVASLATKDELRQGLRDTRDELRRHMDVWAERIHDEVKIVAEGHVALDGRTARQHEEALERVRRLAETDARQHAQVTREVAKLDTRLSKVEGKPPRKRRAS
jgi:hypothetical protein